MLISLVWKIILQASQQYQLTWGGLVFSLCIYQSLDRTMEWVFEQLFIIYIYMLKQIGKQWHVNTHEEMYEFAAREQNALPCILYVLQVKVGAWELGRHMLVLWKSGWWKEGVMMDGRPIPRWDLENPSWTARGLPLQVTFHWFCEQDFSSQCWWDVSCLLALCYMLGIWAMLS
jgi:hypothetical protein